MEARRRFRPTGRARRELTLTFGRSVLSTRTLLRRLAFDDSRTTRAAPSDLTDAPAAVECMPEGSVRA